MEDQTKALQDSIRLGDLLNQLKTNAAFKELILKGYIEDGIAGNMTALPFSGNKDQRERLNDNLLAIAKFKNYLDMIEHTADKAKYMLENPEEEDNHESE